jgi:tRNA pseudouridine13 synthase
MTGSKFTLPSWCRYLGDPEVSGVIRVRMEDFQVREIPLVHPSDEGGHLWLEVEKRGANTNWVAEQLASTAGVQMRDVGFAGMKDRYAVTTQWFSLSLQEACNPDWKTWIIPDVTIVQAHHHSRKLKRGALKGNHFRIVVRLLEGNTTGLENRLDAVSRRGVPNYFGPQRFGFNGSNIERGIRWLEQGSRLSRNKRSIHISAVRSFLFNEVLSRRVEDGSWNRILDGELAMLDGSHSLFDCTMPDQLLARRCDQFDIHPTGPLAGSGGLRPERQAALVENESLGASPALVGALHKAGAKAGRRGLRLLPGKLEWDLKGAVLRLVFDLPPGGYATSLLRELVSFTERSHIPEA